MAIETTTSNSSLNFSFLVTIMPTGTNVRIAFSNDAARRAASRKRRMGILKKMEELNFLGQRIEKHQEKIKKLQKEIRKKEMTMFIYRCVHAGRLLPGSDNMTLDDMNNLVSIVEQKMKDISGRFEAMDVKEKTPHQPQIQSPALDECKPHLKAEEV